MSLPAENARLDTRDMFIEMEKIIRAQARSFSSKEYERNDITRKVSQALKGHENLFFRYQDALDTMVITKKKYMPDLSQTDPFDTEWSDGHEEALKGNKALGKKELEAAKQDITDKQARALGEFQSIENELIKKIDDHVQRTDVLYHMRAAAERNSRSRIDIKEREPELLPPPLPVVPPPPAQQSSLDPDRERMLALVRQAEALPAGGTTASLPYPKAAAGKKSVA